MELKGKGRGWVLCQAVEQVLGQALWLEGEEQVVRLDEAQLVWLEQELELVAPAVQAMMIRQPTSWTS